MSPFKPQCENTCTTQILQLRQDAITRYRSIQAGMRKQAERLEAMRRAKLRDERSFTTLKNEKIELQNLLLELQTLQVGEDYWETRSRWELLQERENSCATGKSEVCVNFFNSSFYSVYELAESIFVASKKARKTGARLKNVTPEKDIQDLSNYVGIERVKRSLCLVEDLLPDEEMRAYANLFEYLDFMRTPGGLLLQNRRDDIKFNEGLLNAYLDKGDKGLVHLTITALEFLSLLLSPILLPIHGVFMIVDYLKNQAWSYIMSIARKGVHDAGIDISIPNPNINSNPNTNIANIVNTNNNNKNLSIWQTLCLYMIQTEDPNSEVSQFLSYLDYSQYSVFMSIQETLYPIYGPFYWAYNIMTRAPYLYFDYYVRDKGTLLPQRRNSCLIRSGIEAIRNELKALAEKIEMKEEMKRLQQEVKEESGLGMEEGGGDDDDGSSGGGSGGSKGTDDSNTSRKRRKKHLAAKNKKKKNTSIEVRDLGPGGNWEVVKDTCLENKFGEYTYKFCYFGDIKQDKTLLGKFNRWGKKKPSEHNEGGGDGSSGSGSGSGGGSTKKFKFANKREEQRTAAAATAASLKVQQDNPEEYYSAHVYEGGARCQVVKGLSRSVQVDFECSPNEAIHQVTEVETCTYHMVVRTPIACSASMEARAMSQLETLGVFGFSKIRTEVDAI